MSAQKAIRPVLVEVVGVVMVGGWIAEILG